MILLTDEQINKEWIMTGGTDLMRMRKLCVAQLCAVVEEIEKPCTKHRIKIIGGHHDYNTGITTPKYGFHNRKRDCPECWAELKKESGGNNKTSL